MTCKIHHEPLITYTNPIDLNALDPRSANKVSVRLCLWFMNKINSCYIFISMRNHICQGFEINEKRLVLKVGGA